MNLTSVLTEVHSVRRLAERFANDLEQGRSIIGLFPATVEPGTFWSAVSALLRQRERDIVEVWLPDLPSDSTMPMALAECLGVRWPPGRALRTVETLLTCDGLPRAIYLAGFHSLNEHERGEWLAFVRRWAAAAHTAHDPTERPAALCLLVPAPFLVGHSLEPNVWLNLRWWWAVPSALELRLLCRHVTSTSDGTELTAIWRENILPSLVGNDVELAGVVWDDMHSGWQQLIQALEMYASRVGWTREVLCNWHLQDHLLEAVRRSDVRSWDPPPRQRDLWAQGLLNWTPEYGTMLSAAALAAVKDTKQIEYRLWRGQVTLLLPMIEQLRLWLCDRWTARHGPNWPWRWQLPRSQEEADAVKQNPYSCGWGHIHILLEHRAELRRELPALPVVRQAHYVRNQLAHYQAVTFQDFEILWHGGESVRRD